MLDLILFAVFPYVAVIVAVVGTIWRFRTDKFSFSSQSSQFLGGTQALSWGSVIWHYGIIIILGIHLIAFLFVDLWSDLLSENVVLIGLEVTGWMISGLVIFGLSLLIFRRLFISTVRRVTTLPDWVLLFLLLLQVVMGLWMAIAKLWGAIWYMNPVVPWLRSLVLLDPDITGVAGFMSGMDWVIVIHILTGFGILMILPFTRLVHVISYPFQYLWRPNQVVVWYRDRRKVRSGSRKAR